MKKLIMTSITAVVVIIVLAGTLIPILDDATATHETFYNEGSFFAEADSDSHTIVVSLDTDNNIIVETDGESCIVPDFTLYSAATILYAENTFVRLSSNGNVILYGSNGSSTYAQTTLGNATGGVTITVTADTASVTYDDTTYSIANVMYFIASTGEMVLSKNPYIVEDSIVVGAGTSTFSSKLTALVFYGTPDDLTLTAVYPSGRSVSLSSVDLAEYSDYIGLYKVNAIYINCYDGSTTLGTATYNYILAPAEVTVERSVHFTDGENAIFNAIPVMIIIALLLGVIALVLRSRMD